STWDALGLRGNQSGPIEVPGIDVPGDQIVGPEGDGAASNDESVDPWFLIGSASVVAIREPHTMSPPPKWRIRVSRASAAASCLRTASRTPPRAITGLERPS